LRKNGQKNAQTLTAPGFGQQNGGQPSGRQIGGAEEFNYIEGGPAAESVPDQREADGSTARRPGLHKNIP